MVKVGDEVTCGGRSSGIVLRLVDDLVEVELTKPTSYHPYIVRQMWCVNGQNFRLITTLDKLAEIA